MDKKRKKTITKIISSVIIFVFVVSIFQFASPAQAVQGDFANTGVLSDLYSNPNQNDGKNPYKFALTSVLKSGMLQQVIGCTGVVNKVSTWMATMIQTPDQIAKTLADNIEKGRALLKSACKVTKATLETTGQSIPTMPGYVKPIDTIISQVTGNVIGGLGDKTIEPMKLKETLVTSNIPLAGLQIRTPQQNEKICEDSVDATDTKLFEEVAKQDKQQQADIFKTQCLDGIAITLAKNQLTAMTRSAMNWVNSGYGGNPFFVQNMQNLTNSIEKNVLDTGTDILLNKAFGNPYAHDFAMSAVTSYNSGSSLRSGATNFLGNLTSDLGAFITDPKSYYTNNQLDQAQDTRTALQRAQDANNAFANDFSTGGWNAWLALTQRDANNPLGFAMQASQYLADQQAAQVQGTNNELLQNNGFLSQKTCISWYMIDSETGEWVYENVTDPTGELGTYERKMTTTNPSKEEMEDPNACAEKKIITPGSIIKDKISNYLDSPDRQLELAKTINDSLNALFSVLISKLEGGGLSGLSDNVTNTSNYTDYMNNSSLDGNTPYSNNGAYDGFNLTRDLGNTYIYTPTPTSLGDWNAKTNCVLILEKTTCPKEEKDWKKLYPDLAPGYYNDEGKFTPYGSNTYYTVTTAGQTSLILEGYNGWAVGDRAFWDGNAWQDWKKGQANPIKKRGVVQIQQDYIVAAQEILGVLPKVMTSLGELDYCIPGPNLSYRTNSADAQLAYQNWVNSIYTGPLNQADSSRMSWEIDRESSTTFKNLSSVFSDNPSVWQKITNSNAVAWFLNYFGPHTDGSNIESTSFEGDSEAKYKEATKLQTIVTNYTNNSLFQNFYNIFGPMMHKIYFDNMTSKYINTEKSINTTLNPAYVPMAQAGLDITKDITSYSNDTALRIQDYKDRIAQAKINIAKLQPIKTEVSAIIKAAQDRRDANLILQINKEGGATKDRTDICKSYLASCGSSTMCKTTYNACIGSNGKDLTIDLYKKIYASCLAEENIQVFDPDEITKGSTTENCTDGIDNDLNGLVDMADSVCWPNGIKPSTNTGRRQ